MKYSILASLLLASVALPALGQATPLTSNEKQALALSQKWITKEHKAIADGSGRVTYYFGSTLPTVVCAPFKTCVLV